MNKKILHVKSLQDINLNDMIKLTKHTEDICQKAYKESNAMKNLHHSWV